MFPYLHFLFFCCGPTRSLTMQMGRSAPEAPVPSRRTACHHVPPSQRSTPCQSETTPTALPCRTEQVTQLSDTLIWPLKTLRWRTVLLVQNYHGRLNDSALWIIQRSRSECTLSSIEDPCYAYKWSGNYDLASFWISAQFEQRHNSEECISLKGIVSVYAQKMIYWINTNLNLLQFPPKDMHFQSIGLFKLPVCSWLFVSGDLLRVYPASCPLTAVKRRQC